MKQNEENTVNSFYIERLNGLNKTLIRLQSIRSRIAWLRFITVLLTVCLLYVSWNEKWYLPAGIIITGICIFLKFVSDDIHNNRQIQNTQTLIAINEEELRILDGKYTQRENGINFSPAHHPYADDMDVFGNNSLFQYINRCNSEQGMNLLAQQFLSYQNKERIILQQEAVKELTGKPLWYQQFSAYGLNNPVSNSIQQKINDWLQQDHSSFNKKLWSNIGYVYLVISLGSAALYITDFISYKIFLILTTLFFFIASFCTKKLIGFWKHLSKITTELQTLYMQLGLIEKENFTSQHLQNIRGSITGNNGKATKAIHQLKQILDLGDLRLNVFLYFILNTFLLWEVWVTIALIKWKNKYAGYTDNWFAAIAETELSISLATLSCNHPQWCVPQISDQYFTLKGTAIGHPLLPSSKCITNDFSTEGIANISLITGSNMGGKSTFLRSIGCNMVLALTGSVVCAKEFTVYPAGLMSSMRIADNLAESTSTFYAELKKLQNIIQVVNNKEEVFILLDEILRGTNSLDKHKGSEALIKQLIHQNAIAVLATHDIELTVLQKHYPLSITNYHFDVQVNNDELYFDYKLKEGICQSLNATLLMKKIGIDFTA